MFHHIFLACEEENGDTFEQADMGTGSLLTQWMAKYGYVPIVLIGVAGLALEIGTGEWQGGETVVAKTPVVVEAPGVAETPVVAEAAAVAKSPDVAVSTIEAEAPVVAG
ncbi:MAG: hypothetical protein WCC80_21730, partial [Pseudolabrys sp.]